MSRKAVGNIAGEKDYKTLGKDAQDPILVGYWCEECKRIIVYTLPGQSVRCGRCHSWSNGARMTG